MRPPWQDPATGAANHSPKFFVDETALVVGVRSMGFLAVKYLEKGRGAEEPRDDGAKRTAYLRSGQRRASPGPD
ncbi:MAG: hypothetical protein IT424_11540 [Pirellulales bacterium]|nr:hypothetical protein [Pirellulales bacterium]